MSKWTYFKQINWLSKQWKWIQSNSSHIKTGVVGRRAITVEAAVGEVAGKQGNYTKKNL